MTQKESLDQFGTIAFAQDFIQATIGFGTPIFDDNTFAGFNKNENPHALCLVVWLSFVPEVYRPDIRAMLETISPQWVGIVATQGSLNVIASDITKHVHKLISTGVLQRREPLKSV